ncbi:MAG TPA: DUF1444 family protein [Gaiellaceae bacterium]|nr:DUF1444 family protein [Gaiellaceae bacterium]
MRERGAVIACLLVALAAGCSGEGDGGEAQTAERTLDRSSFQEAVTAELRGEGYEVEPVSRSVVRVTEGPNWIEVDLAAPFAEYETAPERDDGIVQEVVDKTRRTLSSGISGAPFAAVEEDVMPLLKAPFELRTYGFEPARTAGPGDLAVVYAVDGGDAFTIVRPEDVERWGTTLESMHGLALDNLLRRTNEDEPLLCEPSGGQELCGWASGDGYDATRMVVPELREQIVDEIAGPAGYAVPMETVFIALPLAVLEERGTERAFRLKVEQDFQTADDPLSRDVFVERGGELTPLR